MKLAVIGGREAAIGFALAGTGDVRVCADRAEAKRALREYSSRDDIGVILIEENYADSLGTEIIRIRESRVEEPYPLVVAIPGFERKTREDV